MEFQQVVDRRRMVRNYTDEPVDPAIVDRMLANALHAPSAGFSQGWAFLLLDTREDVGRFWRSTDADEALPNRWLRGMHKAPVIVVPLSCKQVYLDRYAAPDKGWTDRDEARWPVPYWDIDTGMAALLILQTATDEGLGGASSASHARSGRRFEPSSASPSSTRRSGPSRSATAPPTRRLLR